MAWGIADTASQIEKIRAESSDYLGGLNSVGEIDYTTYSKLWDFYHDLLGKAYEQGLKDAEPTEEQVEEYCRNRCLVVVTCDLFNEMKARWSATHKSVGNALEALDEVREEEPEINPCRGCEDYDGEGGCLSNGGCGVKMDEVRDE